MLSIFFRDSFVDLIKKGDKTTTWRIPGSTKFARTLKDEMKSGLSVYLCGDDGTPFAVAYITSIKDTSFGKLVDEDFEGHEPYTNIDEAKRIFSGYYGIEVNDDTELRIIRFKVINFYQ